MCGMRKLLVGTLLLTLSSGTVAADDTLTRIFAECVGRYSAEREHAWLIGSPDAEALDDQRNAFLSLLDATMAQNEASRALTYRIEVKMAHHALLTRSTFGQDSRLAAQARQLARHHLGACRRLLLQS